MKHKAIDIFYCESPSNTSFMRWKGQKEAHNKQAAGFRSFNITTSGRRSLFSLTFRSCTTLSILGHILGLITAGWNQCCTPHTGSYWPFVWCVAFGKYNPGCRCSLPPLSCSQLQYMTHKNYSSNRKCVIFKLQRLSLYICLNCLFPEPTVFSITLVGFYLLPYHFGSCGTEEAKNSLVIFHHFGSPVRPWVWMEAEMMKKKKGELL